MNHELANLLIFLLLTVLVNSGTARADMTADSPVTFPAEGALPAKFPPDHPATRNDATEEGGYLFATPERSLEQIAAIQAEMPPVRFTPPPRDWRYLHRTWRTLLKRGDLRLFAIGDSIVNDAMRSGWVATLQERFPKARIDAAVYVRGGGGCQYFRENERIVRVVVPRKPNLVLIGGISQKDIKSIEAVIRQLRASLPDVEILLFTGAFGTADPRDEKALAEAPYSGTGAYGRSLRRLAERERCAYLDLTTPWAEAIRSSKEHPHSFYRDVVHANEAGEQILGRIFMSFFGVKAVRDISYVTGGHPRQALDLFLPENGKNLPLILLFHGGAFMMGDKGDEDPSPWLADGFAVASVNYRLSQHAVFPALVEDAKAAVRWLRARANGYGIDPSRFGAWGPSAGGYLVAMLGVTGETKEFDAGENSGVSSRIQAVADFFGPTDFLQMDAHLPPNTRTHNDPDSPESRLIGGPIQENSDRVRKATPMTYVTKNAPPFFIAHGENDPIVPHHQSELLEAALRKAGVPVERHTVRGAGHGFDDPDVTRKVHAFFGRHLKPENQGGNR